MSAGGSRPFVIIRLAEAADDFFIEELAKKAGLTVQASAERERECALLYVAEQRERPVGFFLAWKILDELELVDIAVSSEARRQGVALSLLTWLVEFARRESCLFIHLEVRAANLAAQGLYGALGFQQVGRRAHYYRDGEDALLFRCCLREPI